MRAIIESWLGVVAATALFASTINASAGDGVVGPGNCDEAGFASVLTAVDAGGGGIVTFDCGSAPLTITLTSYKTISNAVTIDGGGVISFDGGGSSAFFQVFASASVTLTRLALRHGNVSAAHPLENFGTLTLDAVMMSNNGVTDSAIANFGTLTLRDSQFFSNVVGASGRGAVLFNDGGDATIEHSTFQDNSAGANAGGTGGAIAILTGTLTVEDSVFYGNVSVDGGAIYIAPGAGAVRISRARFNNNLAGYGAAIESWGADVGIIRGTFAHNDATSGDGGAIWSVAGSLAIDFSTFDDNAATTTGGAVSCYGDALAVSHSTFSNNFSETTGGAVYSTCALSARDVTFAGNGALGSGGAIYQNADTNATISYATIANNSAPFGAGLYNDGGSSGVMHVGNSIVSANTTGNCDGTFASDGWNLSDDSGCGAAFTGPGDLINVATPLLALDDYGGPTRTRPPAPGNPAIDHVPLADPSCAPGIDQRGALRPFGSGCDSGAIEVGDVIFADDFDP